LTASQVIVQGGTTAAAQIGHGGAGSTAKGGVYGNYGNIFFSIGGGAVGETGDASAIATVTLAGGTGCGGFGEIGHGGYASYASGTTSAGNFGRILFFDFTSIGHEGATGYSAATYMAAVTVQGGYLGAAQIGHGGATSTAIGGKYGNYGSIVMGLGAVAQSTEFAGTAYQAGTLALIGGTGASAFAQIGSGGFQSNATGGSGAGNFGNFLISVGAAAIADGNATVNAVVSLLGGEGAAQIGHGGSGSTATGGQIGNFGEVTLAVGFKYGATQAGAFSTSSAAYSSSTLTVQGGTAFTGFAQIGDGGNGSTAIGTSEAGNSGRITITVGSGATGYTTAKSTAVVSVSGGLYGAGQIGHGGDGSTATGGIYGNYGDITLASGADATASAAYGVVSVFGSLGVYGGGGTGGFAQIGHGGSRSFANGTTIAGNYGSINITVGGYADESNFGGTATSIGQMVVSGGGGSGSAAQIGHGGYQSTARGGTNGNYGGIAVNVTGHAYVHGYTLPEHAEARNQVTLQGGTGLNAFAQIGHGGAYSQATGTTTAGNAGDITVTVGGTASAGSSAGTADSFGDVAVLADAAAQIGSGGYKSTAIGGMFGNYSNVQVNIIATAHATQSAAAFNSLRVNGATGLAAFAQMSWITSLPLASLVSQTFSPSRLPPWEIM
jgi:hypothetical protein